MLKRVIQILLFLLISSLLFAGTSGKISGVVTSEETGEPLPGVNVILEGTFLGAATDIDGYFVILNVPAGKYSIHFTYIGFHEVIMKNIRVVPDLTKRLEVSLKPSTIDLTEAIVIMAEKPFFEVSATNTVKVLDSEEIEKIPVKGVNKIVSLNAGVVMADGSGGETGNATINVRGGRGNETLVVVDGIPFNDLLSGGSLGSIPDNAIEQISSQLGGFSSKYGSAQSGVINIVTKSGRTKYFGSVEAISSELTDSYGYNDVNAAVGGPIIPGNNHYFFFASGEYISADNDNPRAISLEIPTAGIDRKDLPDAESSMKRLSSKFDANYNKFKISLGFNASLRKTRNYIHSYAKNNSEHNPETHTNVIGTSLKLTNFINETTYWNVVLRYKDTRTEAGDGVWFDDVFAYGDSLRNAEIGVTIPGDAQRVLADEVGVFFGHGRISNNYRKSSTQTAGIDLNFTKQLKSHLIEFGGIYEMSKIRYFTHRPLSLASNKDLSIRERYYDTRPFFFGYDIMGNETEKTTFSAARDGNVYMEDGPKEPITAAVYLQDKVEFADFILNLGIRWDYFDPKTLRIKDPEDIFGYGDNPNLLEREDYEWAPAETHFSPRIGFAFPVSEKTVFHAQYGIFRQAPRLLDIYGGWFAMEALERDNNRTAFTGHLQSESTTQYEFGFRQQFGNVASLDITAFYKNVKGLTNYITYFTRIGASSKRYMSTANTDFGTIRGLAFAVNLRRIGPLSAKLDYTLSTAEGTGSSQASSFTAAFRNTNGEIPKSIAPLNFDQRHTLTASIDIRADKDEGPAIGNFKVFENTGLNLLINYNSGRPYTPLEYINILPGAATNAGDLTQYINSAVGGGCFRIDLKIDRTIKLFGNATLVPYLFVQNVLGAENPTDYYASTGLPDNSAFLDTELGQGFIDSSKDPEAFKSDYEALERDPENYGIPRIIRLGLKLRF